MPAPRCHRQTRQQVPQTKQTIAQHAAGHGAGLIGAKRNAEDSHAVVPIAQTLHSQSCWSADKIYLNVLKRVIPT